MTTSDKFKQEYLQQFVKKQPERGTLEAIQPWLCTMNIMWTMYKLGLAKANDVGHCKHKADCMLPMGLTIDEAYRLLKYYDNDAQRREALAMYMEREEKVKTTPHGHVHSIILPRKN